MTATASDTPDLEKKELPRIEAEVYSRIALNELIVYAVQYLHEQGVTATVEEVISACFRLFPHVFSLKNYFYWPDSALVTHHLNEAKDKGYIKGNPAEGFALKVLGRQVAKQVAISLGLPRPIFIKVKRPKPAPKKPEPVKPTKPRAKKVSKKQVTVKKKTTPKQTKPEKKAVSKKGKAEKASVVASPAPIKRKVAAKPKQKQKEAEKKKLPVPAQKKEKLLVKHKARKTQLARQLPLPTSTAAKKEEIKPAAAKPKPEKKKIAAAPTKVKIVRAKKPLRIAKAAAPIMQIPAVSKEEKAKAGKVLHTLERSDAYRQYKKVGQKAKISEFDFRNMLFATMESSAETLKRNVELFKRYAGMHNRQDLAIFLNFSEESFAPLLKPSGKKIKTKKK